MQLPVSAASRVRHFSRTARASLALHSLMKTDGCCSGKLCRANERRTPGSFQSQQPLVCDTFKNCEGLSRVAFLDGNGLVLLGKVVSCARKEEIGGKKSDDPHSLSNPMRWLNAASSLSSLLCAARSRTGRAFRASNWKDDARESCAVRKKGGHRSGWRHEEVTCSFQPQQHHVCDTFKNYEGLSRVAFLEGKRRGKSCEESVTVWFVLVLSSLT